MRSKRFWQGVVIAGSALAIAAPAAQAGQTSTYWTTAKAEARAAATLRAKPSAAEFARLRDAIEEAQAQQEANAAAGNTTLALLWAKKALDARFALKKAQDGVAALDARCTGRGTARMSRYASFACTIIFPSARQRIVLVPTGPTTFRTS